MPPEYEDLSTFLTEELGLQELPDRFDVPEDLTASVMAAVAVAAASEPALRREPERRRRRFALPSWRPLAGGLALAAAAVVAVVIALGARDTAPVELEGPLASPAGEVNGTIEVALLGSGRRVLLESSDYEILPKGEFYEVWFVGPGDTAQDPNRISAGTFHPDEEGVTDVELHAAVDPARYPRVEITAEPAGGQPAVEGPIVAELEG